MLLGVDVGGTFTDAVLAVDGRLSTAKAPTTPEDPSQGVLPAVHAALAPAGGGAAAGLARQVAEVEPEAVAVALLHSYRHPQHEVAIGEALAAVLPGVHVSLSHEVVGTFREFERASTTEVDAALSPLLGGYLRR